MGALKTINIEEFPFNSDITIFPNKKNFPASNIFKIKHQRRAQIIIHSGSQISMRGQLSQPFKGLQGGW